MDASLHRLAALVLVAGAFGSTWAATTEKPEPAVWRTQELTFDYVGFTTHYSCDGLRDKVEQEAIEHQQAYLNITAMMDMMTILLVFLLKQFSVQAAAATVQGAEARAASANNKKNRILCIYLKSIGEQQGVCTGLGSINSVRVRSGS